MIITKLDVLKTPLDTEYKNIIDLKNPEPGASIEQLTGAIYSLMKEVFINTTISATGSKSFKVGEDCEIFAQFEPGYKKIKENNYCIINSTYFYFITKIEELNSSGAFRLHLKWDSWLNNYPYILYNKGSLDLDTKITMSHQPIYSDISGGKQVARVQSDYILGYKKEPATIECKTLPKMGSLVDTESDSKSYDLILLKVNLKNLGDKKKYFKVSNYDTGTKDSFNAIDFFYPFPYFYVPVCIMEKQDNNFIDSKTITIHDLKRANLVTLKPSEAYQDFLNNVSIRSYIDSIEITSLFPFNGNIVKNYNEYGFVFEDYILYASLNVYTLLDNGQIDANTPPAILGKFLFPNQFYSAALQMKYEDTKTIYLENDCPNSTNNFFTIEDITKLCPELECYPIKYKEIQIGANTTTFTNKYFSHKNSFVVSARGYSASISYETIEKYGSTESYKTSAQKNNAPINNIFSVPFSEDAYNNFLIANSNQMNNELVSGVFRSLKTALTGQIGTAGAAIAGSPVAPAIAGANIAGSLVSGAIDYNITEWTQEAKLADVANSLNSLKGGSNGLTAINTLNRPFVFEYDTDIIIKKQIAKSIYENGSAFEHLGNILDNNRVCFDYVKTEGFTLAKSVNNSDSEVISKIFNRGVTKWHIDSNLRTSMNNFNKHIYNLSNYEGVYSE